MISKKLTWILIICIVFTLGWLSNSVYSLYTINFPLLNSPDAYIPSNENNYAYDSENDAFLASLSGVFIEKPLELASPSDHIEEDQINVYDEYIVLDIEDAIWTGFTDTNSMDPIMDASANGIEIVPETGDEIEIGDIISYETIEGSVVVHRVIDIQTDSQGIYFTVKGDNNPVEDEEKVRFNQVRGIVVAIIY